MKHHHFILPNDLGQLHDELLAAFPGLAGETPHTEDLTEPVFEDRTERVYVGPDEAGNPRFEDQVTRVQTGTRVRQTITVYEPNLRVEGTGGNVLVTVPDDQDEAALAAVVAAHVPRPTAPAPITSVGVETLAQMISGSPDFDTFKTQVLALLAQQQ